MKTGGEGQEEVGRDRERWGGTGRDGEGWEEVGRDRVRWGGTGRDDE